VIAWVAAKLTAEYTFGEIQQMLEEIAAPGKIFPTINFMFAICGVIGGLVVSEPLCRTASGRSAPEKIPMMASARQ
jgi:hypothetical protein